ncbi:TPA: helix-turn-helix transcriptional regulator [Clostridioides difficile]|uniref:helix-turn-helix domain-containing protein n=1 Tax=Clostridioides difficile TaxID=1496 RepID=UPI00038D0112|nr:helix-turn-helix transcriptional regulator [Clostridioides difficile]EGT5367783.1 XRE family transcriptional regulator [Clostridioides difficile]EII6750072.1 helix-turn-helix transcriptional regulator [Clostridioides difficile]EII6791163.1 helix-turn-helix transcriptional regulator [Clostridioides difficile]EQJ64581.1 helix-turn-helix family protein [Clostridioides difficile P38]EQK57120.1 helix-turn-helix family protein [Clostridioides difficile F548]
MNTSQRIKYLRENMNMSQKELSEKANINTSVMNRIESGERAIRDDELIIFAKIFGVSTDYILGLSDTEKLNLNESYEFIDSLNSPDDIKELIKIVLSLDEETRDKMLKIAKVFVTEKNIEHNDN